MTYKISPIQESEIDEVIDFHNKYLGERDFINKEEIFKRLHSNSGIFLIAKDKNKIIGIKLGYINNDICIGRGIAVDNNYRRLGIGRSLVKAFEKELKKHNQVKKYVFASSTKEGIPFHIRLGYKPIVLLQSEDNDLLKEIDLKNSSVIKNSYNDIYNTYQLFIKPDRELDLGYLSELKSRYPDIDIQYLFEKNL